MGVSLGETIKKYIFIDVENLRFLKAEKALKGCMQKGYTLCLVGDTPTMTNFLIVNNLVPEVTNRIKPIYCDSRSKNSSDLLITCLIGVVLSETCKSKVVLLTFDTFGLSLKSALEELNMSIEVPLNPLDNNLYKKSAKCELISEVLENIIES